MNQVVEQGPAVSAARIVMQRVSGTGARSDMDSVAVEEPLEIRIAVGDQAPQPVAVTMRTPGDDLDLAIGYLWTEGILTNVAQIRQVRRCGAGGIENGNVVRVDLSPDAQVDLERLERHFFMSSSCGVCGKASLEAVRTRIRDFLIPGVPLVDPTVILRLPATLRQAQAVFDCTGGLHAAGLFDVDGNLIAIREDVGRHNALDKLIGGRVRARKMPLSECIAFLSGRGSFELVQKARMAGIAIVAAVGPPSSLAVDLARECGMTVIGFIRDGRFNIYCGAERIEGAHADDDSGFHSYSGRVPLPVR